MKNGRTMRTLVTWLLTAVMAVTTVLPQFAAVAYAAEAAPEKYELPAGDEGSTAGEEEDELTGGEEAEDNETDKELPQDQNVFEDDPVPAEEEDEVAGEELEISSDDRTPERDGTPYYNPNPTNNYRLIFSCEGGKYPYYLAVGSDTSLKSIGTAFGDNFSFFEDAASVETSEDSEFSVYRRNGGQWYVSADGELSADRWMKVTGKDGTVTDITVKGQIVDNMCGDNLTWEFDNGKEYVNISGTGDMWNYECAEDSPFHDLQINTGTVAFSDEMTSIGDHAFEGLNIRAFVPFSQKWVLPYMYSACFTGNLTRIGEAAFKCKNKTTSFLLTIDKPLEYIGEEAFFGSCLILQCDEDEVYKTYANGINPDNNYFISENGALYDKERSRIFCGPQKKYVHDYVIPATVTTIDSWAFSSDYYDAYWQDHIDIIIEDPSNIRYVGDYAFCVEHASSLSGTGDMTLSYLGEHAFENCSLFEGTITLDENCSEIGESTFKGCSSLKGFASESPITSVGAHAFDGCKAAEGVITLDGCITDIPEYAFAGCNVAEFNMRSPLETVGAHAFDGFHSETGTINLSVDFSEAPEYAFNDCSGVTINIPEGMELNEMDIRAFNHCTSLTGDLTIRIVDNLWSLRREQNGRMFEGCTSLTSLNFMGTTRINERSFADCTGLKTVSLNSDHIHKSAFSGCTSLETLYIDPTNATSTIEDGAFENCTSLKNITMPDNVRIGEGVFAGCTSLTEMNMPFKYGGINDGDDAKTLPKNSFSGCTSLKKSRIAEGTDSIKENAFKDCSALEEIWIPASVTSIDQTAFNGCVASNLTVHFGGTDSQWGALAHGNLKLNNVKTVECNVEAVPRGTVIKKINGQGDINISSSASEVVDPPYEPNTGVIMDVVPGEGQVLTSLTVTDSQGCDCPVSKYYSAQFDHDYRFSFHGEYMTVTATFEPSENVITAGTEENPCKLTNDHFSYFLNDGWYEVAEDITVYFPVTVSGDVNLILGEGTTLNAECGIDVTVPNSLTISGEGTLNAYGYQYAAGIGGGNRSKVNGEININGGHINAVAQLGAAGIGAGNIADGGVININGGTVYARSDAGGAGIGSGRGKSGGTITINGGNITAIGKCNGNMWPAAIGGGAGGAGGTIIFNGGTIHAEGAVHRDEYEVEFGPAIGGGISRGSAIPDAEIEIGDGVKVTTGKDRSPVLSDDRAEACKNNIVDITECPHGTMCDNAGGLFVCAYCHGEVPAHTLTINYVRSDGSEACGSVAMYYAEGAAYSVDSPAMAGLTPDPATVIGTMGVEDVTVNVVYKGTGFVSPMAKRGLVYNGQPQELIEPGAAAGSTIYYAATTGSAAPSEDMFSEAVPAATDAGAYAVWYRVKGDRDLADSAPVALRSRVTIERAEYDGVKTVDVAVMENKAETGVQAFLPALPDDAVYDGTTITLGNESGLIVGEPALNGNLLTFDTTEKAAETYATITVNAKHAKNYRDYQVVATVTARANELHVDGIAGQVYTGSAITPEPRILWQDKVLEKGVDYTLTYKNNVNAASKNDNNAPTVIVTGKGNYKDKKEIKFDIAKLPIGDGTTFAPGFDVTIADQISDNGKIKESVPTIKYGKTVLREDKDYSLEYENELAIGTATVTVTCLQSSSNFSGYAKVAYRIYDKNKSLSNAVITLAQTAVPYSVSEAERRPAVTSVKLNSSAAEALRAGTDYTVSYKNDSKVGTATVTVTGAGEYGGSKSATYRIKAKDLTGAAVVTVTGSAVYTGKALNPAVEVRDGETLIPADQYTLAYVNATNAAAADAQKAPAVTVRFKGNYTGSTVKKFAITPRRVPAGELTATFPDIRDTGKAIDAAALKPTVAIGKTTLKRGTDYDVDFTRNPSRETQRATVTLKGNYQGSYDQSFRIFRDNTDLGIGSFTVTMDRANYIYTGTAIIPQVTVKTMVDNTVKVLEPGKDFTVTATNNINVPGENAARLPAFTVTGKGTYKGKRTQNFTIVPATLTADDLSVTFPDVQSKTNKTIDAASLTPTVKWGKVTLKKGTDYDVTYTRDENALQTAGLTLKGNYRNAAALNYSFRIYGDAADISTAAFTCTAAEATYTGGRLTPEVTVKTTMYGGEPVTLTEGRDYTVTYTNNVAVPAEGAPAAKLPSYTVTGKGAYKGRKTGNFTIHPLALAADELSVAVPDIVRRNNKDVTAADVKPAVKWANVTLKQGTDYDVTDFAWASASIPQTAKIRLKGNYANNGEIPCSFNVLQGQTDLFGATVVVSDAVYTGGKLTPGVTVKVTIDGYEATLVEGKDYTVAYTNNTDAAARDAAKAPTVTVTGKAPAYKGRKTGTFTIEPLALTAADLTVSIPDIKDTGKAVTDAQINPTITYGKMTLKKGKDYTVTYDRDTAREYQTAKITLTGSLRGSFTHPFRIYRDDTNLAVGRFVIAPEKKALVYTGDKLTPAVTVKSVVDGREVTLVSGRDYTAAYTNNINAAAGDSAKAPTITVTGKGIYKGARKCTFTIRCKELSKNTCTLTVDDAKYNKGNALKPKVTVTDKARGKVLTVNKDYTLAYSNNTALGEKEDENAPTVVIRGIGNYSEPASADRVPVGKFRIYLKDISTAVVQGLTSKGYTGFAIRPDDFSVFSGKPISEDKALTKGTHYTVSYGDNVKAGTGTVILTGKGEYGGTRVEKFTILPKWVSELLQAVQ